MERTRWRKTKQGKVSDHPYFLASIMAPKVATNTRDDEPFGYEAREFLRKAVIGKKVEFHVEYGVNERKYGTLFLKTQNMNLELAKTGLVRILERRGDKMTLSQWHDDYEDAASTH